LGPLFLKPGTGVSKLELLNEEFKANILWQLDAFTLFLYHEAGFAILNFCFVPASIAW
jgi:hypothetical protein